VRWNSAGSSAGPARPIDEPQQGAGHWSSVARWMMPRESIAGGAGGIFVRRAGLATATGVGILIGSRLWANILQLEDARMPILRSPLLPRRSLQR
jgi:hypothetical protein